MRPPQRMQLCIAHAVARLLGRDRLPNECCRPGGRTRRYRIIRRLDLLEAVVPKVDPRTGDADVAATGIVLLSDELMAVVVHMVQCSEHGDGAAEVARALARASGLTMDVAALRR